MANKINKIIAQFVDEESNLMLIFYTVPFENNEENIESEMMFKEIMLKYFSEGKIAILYDPVKKVFKTIPSVIELMKGDD
jgi:hypothetical protein